MPVYVLKHAYYLHGLVPTFVPEAEFRRNHKSCRGTEPTHGSSVIAAPKFKGFKSAEGLRKKVMLKFGNQAVPCVIR